MFACKKDVSGQFGARPSGRHANSTPDHRRTSFYPRLYVSVAAFCPRTFRDACEQKKKNTLLGKGNAIFGESFGESRRSINRENEKSPEEISKFGSRRVSFASNPICLLFCGNRYSLNYKFHFNSANINVNSLECGSVCRKNAATKISEKMQNLLLLI